MAAPSSNPESVGAALLRSIHTARLFTVGDQVTPCAILWTDAERQWESIINQLQTQVPELCVLGPFAPNRRTGPAAWLRCVEGRTVEPRFPPDLVPILYLPGVSRQQLRATEECPADLQPLVELLFRGAVWSHPNGKDWTPLGFLTSEHGGLECDVSRDSATGEALLRALPVLLQEPVASLRAGRLDAEFFNNLLAPDLPSQVLRWMNEPARTRGQKTANEWKAFCQQCVADYQFHPDKDGELRAAELLGRKTAKWQEVWRRFSEAPQRYGGLAGLLGRASPADGELLLFDQDAWPQFNDTAEARLAAELRDLKGKRRDQAAKRIAELESEHGRRRRWVWRELGRAPLAVALEPLAKLAESVGRPLGAASADELAAQYAAAGWETDAAALSALACAASADLEEPICTAVRALYLPWLDEVAHTLQMLRKAQPDAMRPRLQRVEAKAGRVILFADGLRFDAARWLVTELTGGAGLDAGVEWDWAPFPSVTATCKPHVSPLADQVKAGGVQDEFGVAFADNGQSWTNERFHDRLTGAGIQVLHGWATGDPGKPAWIEAGSLDKHGHAEGWKLARSVAQEVQDLACRIRGLLAAGWQEAVVVTDHGWLLAPGGLPKIELPKYLAAHRWGRCAWMEGLAQTTLPLLPWHWNVAVMIASPPGAGAFQAGIEFAHGGISVQEMVVPRLTIRAGGGKPATARILAVKWTGLRCRVSIEGGAPGLRVDLRSRPADPSSSCVEGGQARDVGADGTASLPLADGCDDGRELVAVLLSGEGHVLHSQPTRP